jgi:hypothetical protein
VVVLKEKETRLDCLDPVEVLHTSLLWPRGDALPLIKWYADESSIWIGVTNQCHVRWVPCHHGMARPQVADGGDALQVWRETANILNKQSLTADKGWSSSLGVGYGANNSSP